MSRLPRRVPGAVALCALLFLALFHALPARANTPIALWKAFEGRVNFAGTQVTLRTGSNTDKGKQCNGNGVGNNGNCNGNNGNGNGNNGNGNGNNGNGNGNNGNGNNGNGNGNNGNGNGNNGNGNGNNGNGNGNNGNGNNKVNACTVTPPDTKRNAILTLPAGAAVRSAQLYWAGSGPSDMTVNFEGKNLTAGRRYGSRTVGGGLDYFGGAADVTGVVQAKGGGTYQFSGLSVSNGDPWCASQAVLGGFALLVVYSHPSEPERVLNIYEGFQHVQNGEVVVNATDFRWKSPLIPIRERARVGHITWEGDPTLEQGGESLLFEGSELSDALNPAGNQFNSRSNINNDSASYGIDFDAYDTEVRDWSMDDATVTTRYRTGQDLVLLNAEILVVPTALLADLSIALARSGALEVGMRAAYTVTVTNKGPYTEPGPVGVAVTLPAGMSHVSASGTGWTCSAAGTAIGCTWKGTLAPGEDAPPLLVTAAVNTAGEKTFRATVTGTHDEQAANNTASDTASARDRDLGTNPTPGTLSAYVFTDSVCTPGIAIGAPGQPCKHWAGPVVGGSRTPIYLTATTSDIPQAPSATETTTASLQFAIACLNPVAGSVGATYAGVAVPACAGGAAPAWSNAVAIGFPAGTVSLAHDFVYNDVGQIRLSLKEGSGTASTEAFVSAPLRIEFKSIRHGGLDNPGNIGPSSTGFAPAAAPLTVEIGARLAGTAGFAPNFGNEKLRPEVLLGHEKGDIDIVSEGELFETGNRAWSKGIMTTVASWSESGAIHFVTGLMDPAAPADAGMAGRYLGVPVAGSKVAVGRFYPAYFNTVVTGNFACPASLPAPYACPREDPGAVYSRQPFKVTVEAFNADNERLENFTGDWFRPVTLEAVNAAHGTPLVPGLVPKAGQATAVIKGAGAAGMEETVAYRLAVEYSNAAPRAADVTVPTAVFVRASAPETTLAAGGARNIVVSSAGAGAEGGVLVLNGRLKVPNALGTDILPTLLGLRAEYWAGARGWLANPGYADALAAPGTATRFIGCTGAMANAGTTCDAVVAASSPQEVRMAPGGRVLRLRAPGKLPTGRTRGGSIRLQFDGWPWLPSTIGRVSFGNHRSPVIYVRELVF